MRKDIPYTDILGFIDFGSLWKWTTGNITEEPNYSDTNNTALTMLDSGSLTIAPERRGRGNSYWKGLLTAGIVHRWSQAWSQFSSPQLHKEGVILTLLMESSFRDNCRVKITCLVRGDLAQVLEWILITSLCQARWEQSVEREGLLIQELSNQVKNASLFF